MTPPRWQVVHPPTWRDKAVIYPLSVVFLIIVVAVIFTFEPFRRGA